MKKIILLVFVVIAVVISTSSYAQMASIRAGVNIAPNNANTSLLFAALVEFKTIERLSIETGVMINTLGKFSSMYLYFNIPLNLKFYMHSQNDFNVYTTFGGFFGNRMTSSNFVSELGLSVGMGVEIKSFLIGMSYDKGKRDITNNINLDPDNFNVRIFIGAKLGK